MVNEHNVITSDIAITNFNTISSVFKVADFIGTEHHEIIFTAKDVAEVLDDVIYSLETFDITTIRASIGYVSNVFSVLKQIIT